MAGRVRWSTVCASLAVVAGCGGGSEAGTATPDGRPPPPAMSTPDDGDPLTDEAKYGVRGHELFMVCRPGDPPTVVYLHGMGGYARSAGAIMAKLGENHRVCAYDRPNGLGISDTVTGPQTGEDGVADLDALLAAADVPGPYVLLGGSFGGLLAGMYAATHPDDVVGMVLLDSPLPDSLAVFDRLIPAADRVAPGDWKENPELYDEWTTFRQARALQGDTPSIPVTYIAVARLADVPRSWPSPDVLLAADRRVQREYLTRFSPGRLVVADVEHYMEPLIPGRIAREVERVIAAAGR